VIEDIGMQAEKIQNRLLAGKYADGGQLIRDWFRGLFHSYQIAPDTFRIIQLFQQTGLVAELNMERRTALDDKGGYNFQLFRRITEEAIKQSLIKKVNVFQFVDAVWGLFVGIIQLEDIKSKDRGINRYLKPTLKLAENMVTEAITLKKKAIFI
jgi:hypothetical protein